MKTKTNILVIDYSVLIYNITANLENLNLWERLPYLVDAFPDFFKGKDPQEVAQDFIKAQWVYHFYRGPEYLPEMEFIPVIVKDSKPYWRSMFFPDYKGNRPPKTDTFYSTKATGERLAKALGIPIFEEFSFEADDISAAIVKHHELSKSCLSDPISQQWAGSHLWLWTVDSDWHQLVSESVTWLNTGPWVPLVRTPKEVLEWTKRRLRTDIRHPQDIVPVKVRQGDKSDNLPPGCEPFFIDLFNTHPQYRLLSREPFLDKIDSIFEAPTQNKKALQGARKILDKFLI